MMVIYFYFGNLKCFVVFGKVLLISSIRLPNWNSFIHLFDMIWFDLLWNFTSQNWPLWADLFICLEKICLRYSWLRLTRYLYVLVWYFSFFFTFSCHILTKKLSSMYFFLFSLKQGKVHSLLNWVKHQPSSNTQLNIHWFFLTNSVRIIFFLEYFQNNV